MTKEGLILTGFMAMGKTSVGSILADRLEVPYYDTDDWMEASGIDVPELVKADVAEFRRVEAEALKIILEQEPGVISTGGGIVSTEFGRAALLAAITPVVWLKAPFEVAVSRVDRDRGRERPLFSDIEKAQSLFEERQQWYQETADYEINAAQPKEKVAGDTLIAIG